MSAAATVTRVCRETSKLLEREERERASRKFQITVSGSECTSSSRGLDCCVLNDSIKNSRGEIYRTVSRTCYR